jgi:integrase
MARKRKHDRHLPACVYQRHGAYWYVKKGRWSRLGATLSEALEKYAAIVAEPTGSMNALIDKALEHIRPGIGESTYRQYKAAAKHLKRRLIEFTPRQVRGKHIAAIKADMRGIPNMANRALSLLRQVFAVALEWEMVDDNPCIGIRRLEEHERDRYITDEEFLAVYAKAGDRLQVVIDLLYLTGQRVRDVLQIRAADLTDVGIEFEPQKTRRSTGGKIVVPWTPELEEVVARAKRLRGNVRALTLLSGRTGKAPDYRTVALQWAKACESAGVQDAQLRDLRAKALTDAEEQGLDPTALAVHSSPQMTKRYLRRRKRVTASGPSKSKILDSPIGHGGEK